MRYKQYRFKFYINIRHYIYIDGQKGNVHPHTWEICLNILKTTDEFILFKRMEKEINDFLQQYQDKLLNDLEIFEVVNPTLENFCEYLTEQLGAMLNSLGYILVMVEISETPTKSYIISFLDDDSSREDQAIDVFTETILKNIKNEL